MKLSAPKHLKCWQWHMVKLFWVKKNVYKWYKLFQDGREDANDEPRSGRPSSVFFDYRGVVHQEFLSYGCTVNKEYYLEVMHRLREAIRRKRPELWKNNSWLLHHDNAPALTPLCLWEIFWPKTTPQSCLSHHIHRIWPHVTFSCSQN